MTHKNQSTALMGSISQVAKAKGISDEDAMLYASTVVAVDTSGSMGTKDAGEGRNAERYAVACYELEVLQSTRPGELVVMSWSGSAAWCFDGVPINQGGGTNILEAIDTFLRAGLDGLLKLTIIADGDVADIQKPEALRIVAKMSSVVDTIFIGNKDTAEGKAGAAFLARLAKVGRGRHATSLEPGMLAKPVLAMIGPPNPEAAPPKTITL